MRALFRRLHDWLFGRDESVDYTVDDLLAFCAEPPLEGELLGPEPNYLDDDLALWARELEPPLIFTQMDTFRRLRVALALPTAEHRELVSA